MPTYFNTQVHIFVGKSMATKLHMFMCISITNLFSSNNVFKQWTFSNTNNITLNNGATLNKFKQKHNIV